MNASSPPNMSDDKLSVELISAVTERVVRFDCVVDADDLNDVLGIEILAFREQIGSAPPPALTQNLLRWSYDADSDSFYMRVADGVKAQKQHACKGVAFTSPSTAPTTPTTPPRPA